MLSGQKLAFKTLAAFSPFITIKSNSYSKSITPLTFKIGIYGTLSFAVAPDAARRAGSKPSTFSFRIRGQPKIGFVIFHTLTGKNTMS
jgi:hypothetical protein